jgi:hypothetical protein
MLIRIVGRARVDLDAEGEQLPLEHLGQRQRLGYLQSPVLEEGLDGGLTDAIDEALG